MSIELSHCCLRIWSLYSFWKERPAVGKGITFSIWRRDLVIWRSQCSFERDWVTIHFPRSSLSSSNVKADLSALEWWFSGRFTKFEATPQSFLKMKVSDQRGIDFGYRIVQRDRNSDGYLISGINWYWRWLILEISFCFVIPITLFCIRIFSRHPQFHESVGSRCSIS